MLIETRIVLYYNRRSEKGKCDGSNNKLCLVLSIFNCILYSIPYLIYENDIGALPFANLQCLWGNNGLDTHGC